MSSTAARPTDKQVLCGTGAMVAIYSEIEFQAALTRTTGEHIRFVGAVFGICFRTATAVAVGFQLFKAGTELLRGHVIS